MCGHNRVDLIAQALPSVVPRGNRAHDFHNLVAQVICFCAHQDIHGTHTLVVFKEHVNQALELSVVFVLHGLPPCG